MLYKIAVATSDGENINETFGSAKSFVIYEVSDGICNKSEERICITEENNCNSGVCGNSAGCGTGCGGHSEPSAKVEIISDCRAIVCKKIGFHIRKQLEHKAISAFDVSCTIDEALDKITFYYNRIDKYEPLRK
ncbi:MAG: hydrogenase [Ruminococcus sp.]|nr:hydrogenase [Ruminococcus sp.]